MEQTSFTSTYGNIVPAVKINRFCNKMRHPEFVNGRWYKNPRNKNGVPIFKGSFYNIGFFPEGVNPAELDFDWESLAFGVELAAKLVKLLVDGECYDGLGSEGDLYWHSVLVPVSETTKDKSFKLADHLVNAIPDEVKQAYANRKIFKSYENKVESWSLDKEENIFWEPENIPVHQSELDDITYKAYCEVNRLMKLHLTGIRCYHLFSDYVVFPVLYVGKDKYGNYLGIMTSFTWT